MYTAAYLSRGPLTFERLDGDRRESLLGVSAAASLANENLTVDDTDLSSLAVTALDVDESVGGFVGVVQGLLVSGGSLSRLRIEHYRERESPSEGAWSRGGGP